MVCDTLRDLGYRVALDDHFKGVDIVRECGAPSEGRNSLQVEVVRTRYMDDFGPGAGVNLNPAPRTLAAMGRRHQRLPRSTTIEGQSDR